MQFLPSCTSMQAAGAFELRLMQHDDHLWWSDQGAVVVRSESRSRSVISCWAALRNMLVQLATFKQTCVTLRRPQEGHAYRGNCDKRRAYEIHWEGKVRALLRLQLSLALRPDPWGQLLLCCLQAVLQR